MKRILLILACAAAAMPLPAETLSLGEAQKQLFKNNLDVLAAEVDLAKAKDDLAETRSAWWPSLDASASYNYLTEKNNLHIPNPLLPGKFIDGTIGPNDRAEAGLDLTCPIFTGLSRYYSMESRSRAVSAKEATLEAVKNRASLSLGILYLQWDLSYKQADLRRALVEQLQTYTRQIQAMREAGTVLQSKLLEVQARLQLAKVDLAADEDRSDSLCRELKSFILNKDDVTTPDTAGIAFDTLPIPKAVDKERPELIALDFAAGQVEQLREAMRYRHFPTIAGVAGLRYGRPGLNMGENKYMGWGLAGVQLKWNWFDGLRTRAQTAQLARQLDMIDIERTRQNEILRKSYEQAQVQVNNAGSRLVATAEAAAAARALTEDLKNALDAGTVTTADYLNALVNQAQADLLVEQAKTARKTAMLMMMYAAGKTIKY